jgi:hypothetical protein
VALSKPKRTGNTAKSPRVWVPKSGVSIWEGAVIGRYPSGANKGFVDNIGADVELVIVGVARHNMGTVPAGHVATFAPQGIVDELIQFMDFSQNSDASTAVRDQVVYGIDESKASLSSADGPPIGAFWEADSTTVGRVFIGPSAVARALAVSGTPGASPAGRPVCRVVVTSLAANTGTTTGTLTGAANGALATQDGLASLVVGDDVFIPEGTTNLAAASDAGPYRIVSLGAAGAKWVLDRPPWWLSGSVIPLASTLEIGPEGTGTDPGYAGTVWKTFAAKGKIVDTDAPAFWPRSVTSAVTLAVGTLAAARTKVPVRGATVTSFIISSNPATAPHATTDDWRVSALTPGVVGTASIQMVAESAPGTTNASDVGQYNLTAVNW